MHSPCWRISMTNSKKLSAKDLAAVTGGALKKGAASSKLASAGRKAPAPAKKAVSVSSRRGRR